MPMEKRTALIFVDRNWFNANLGVIAAHKSKSDGEVHLVIADASDTTSHLGLWLKNINIKRLRKDGADSMAEALIPWPYIRSLLLVDKDDAEERIKLGFQGAEVTDLR